MGEFGASTPPQRTKWPLGGGIKATSFSRNSPKDLAKADWGKQWLAISSHSGEGIEPLRDTIAAMVDRFVKPLENYTFITSARHRDALNQTLASLAKFFGAFANEDYEEMMAFELREARDHLQSIVGAIGTEDVLDDIFSSFCIGK